MLLWFFYLMANGCLAHLFSDCCGGKSKRAKPPNPEPINKPRGYFEDCEDILHVLPLLPSADTKGMRAICHSRFEALLATNTMH